MKFIFFWILLPLFSIACGPSAPVKKRFIECYVRYLAPEGQLTAEANFSEATPGQTAPSRVQAPGEIKYRDVDMRLLQLQGPSYRLTPSGGYPSQHTFRWTDEAGQHTFGVEMAPVTVFTFDTLVISRDQPATLRWEGGPLEKGEIMVMMWERAEGHLTVPFEISGTPGIQSVEFPAAKLKELAPGDWTLYLVRKKAVRTDVDGIEASALVEYYTPTQALTIR